MELLSDILKYFDEAIQGSKNEKKKQKILFNMLIVECKFNLDVLNIIDFEKGEFTNKPQIVEVVNLLSNQALEKLLVYEQTTQSFISESFEKLLSVLKFKDDESQIFIIDNNNLFNLYKRINLIKALTRISESNIVIKQINYKTRLINLKDVLLEVVKIQI